MWRLVLSSWLVACVLGHECSPNPCTNSTLPDYDPSRPACVLATTNCTELHCPPQFLCVSLDVCSTDPCLRLEDPQRTQCTPVGSRKYTCSPPCPGGDGCLACADDRILCEDLVTRVARNPGDHCNFFPCPMQRNECEPNPCPENTRCRPLDCVPDGPCPNHECVTVSDMCDPNPCLDNDGSLYNPDKTRCEPYNNERGVSSYKCFENCNIAHCADPTCIEPAVSGPGSGCCLQCVCPAGNETSLCPDGVTVVRQDPNNGCRYPACPKPCEPTNPCLLPSTPGYRADRPVCRAAPKTCPTAGPCPQYECLANDSIGQITPRPGLSRATVAGIATVALVIVVVVGFLLIRRHGAQKQADSQRYQQQRDVQMDSHA